MRAVLLVIALITAGLGAARAEDAAGEQIRGVIQSQIDAFLAEDAATAFTFASPTIKGIFMSPENFRRMVETGYPMIWKPSAVEFLGLREENGMTFQRVKVTDGAGAAFLFDYEMVALPEGWRINGVFPVRDSGVGV